MESGRLTETKGSFCGTPTYKLELSICGHNAQRRTEGKKIRADAGGTQVMKAAMQRLRQTTERGRGRQAKGAGLPFWPWSAWVGHGSGGMEHQKGGPPHRQALLPRSWRARGLSAHLALPVNKGWRKGQGSHFFFQNLFLPQGHPT